MSGTPLDLSFCEKDHIVKAGAGAGKTYSLVECVVQSYRHFRSVGKTRPRFVLTTFTRKATQELRERMVLKACELDDPDFFSFVTDPGYLTISTIHGVLGQFLKEFGHLYEMDLSFKILEGDDEALLLENSGRELLVARPENLSWLEDFSFSRLLGMLKAYHFHVRKNELLRPPEFEEVWEHSLKFVQEKKDHLLEQIEYGLNTIEDGPYLKSLSEIKEFLNIWEPGIELEIPALARKAKRESFPVHFHEEMGEAIKKFKGLMTEILLSPSELKDLSYRWRQFSEFAKEYSQLIESRKQAGGFVTLSDLENQAHQVLKQAPFLGRIFSENYDFWLIDEFQDTSSHQLSILNHLIGDRPRFVVGDPQQSIYLFRGAESHIFEEEWNRILKKGGRNSRLEKNYRSQKDLLSLFNKMMSQSSQFAPMTPHCETDANDNVACFIEAIDLQDELKGLYERALELCQENSRWDEICVLGRTHDDLFKVASYFKSRGIPTHVHSPLGYSLRREVQDAISIYKFLINPHDNLNLLQILRSPWLKVEDIHLKNWMDDSPVSLWMSICDNQNETAVMALRRAQDRLEDQGLLKTFIDLLSEIRFIEMSAVFDPSGRVEANIWKLIKKMKDLERMPGTHPLDILTSLDQESDAVAATEPNCVNLMTIHGSKGLEFEHVFFPRLGRRFQTSKRGAISFSPQSDLFVFSLKDDDDQSLVCSYERDWIDLQKIRERHEVERWFYVALTRARKSVTLSWNHAEMAGDSWVRAFNLETFEFSGLNRRKGPFEERPELQSSHSGTNVCEPYMKDLKETRTLSRSSFTELSAESSKVWSYESLQKKFSAQAKGIHWHRLFEGIRFQGVEEGLNQFPFLKNLTSPPFKEVLENGYVEWGFQCKRGQRILEGQIDLWGFDSNNRLWVIDYKTGSSRSQEKATLQVQFYLWILRQRGVNKNEPKPSEFCWAVIYPFEERLFQGSMTEKDFASLEGELGLS